MLLSKAVDSTTEDSQFCSRQGLFGPGYVRQYAQNTVEAAAGQADLPA